LADLCTSIIIRKEDILFHQVFVDFWNEHKEAFFAWKDVENLLAYRQQCVDSRMQTLTIPWYAFWKKKYKRTLSECLELC
jgi:hypothetical protein